MANMSKYQVEVIRSLTKTAKLTETEREGLITKMKAHLSGEAELTREWADSAIAKLMRKGGQIGGIKVKTNVVKTAELLSTDRKVTVKCRGHWTVDNNKTVKHDCDVMLTGTAAEVGLMETRCDDCRAANIPLPTKG